MEQPTLCQSCSMPLDANTAGTEKNGTASKTYCKYCYQDGQFVNPNLTLEEMRQVIKREMAKRNIPDALTSQAVNVLPTLKRWQSRK